MRIKSRGKYYDELNVGDIYEHAITRTVTETDNLLFTTLTHNPQPLHLDMEFSKSSINGTTIFNNFFTMAFVVGASVSDLTLFTTIAHLNYEEITNPVPVRIGDTLRAETEIIAKNDEETENDCGKVWFEHRGYNQNGELVCKIKRVALMLKSEHAIV
ncbi:MaoC family dehydratase [Bacillus sp. B15-48]|uniref:MaoC family dehydratase n=1 Tax=Bacillus sp. B15-48 TaxID=1548601 RepID=UPI00193EE963|nr:MaoC family dehydratase [Bacillus sp. B15-48]MBM4763373.1 MaoC family dehydratase [Bacillus sp. B15-48]